MPKGAERKSPLLSVDAVADSLKVSYASHSG